MTMMRSEGIEGFMAHNRRKTLFIVVLTILTTTASFVALGYNTDVPLDKLLGVLFDRGNPSNDFIDDILVWDLGIPRILSAILAGIALGVAGAVMQCVLRNPLGSPYTLGVSNAAAFGASIGIVILGGGLVAGQSTAHVVVNNPFIVTVSAFAWAMIATGIIIALVKITKVSPETMVLAGVALSSIFSAGISLLQYMYNEYALSTIVFWQFGDMGKASMEQLYLIAAVAFVACAYFLYHRLDYNALDVGDDVASSLGINVNRLRILSLILASVLTAIVVSFMGVIAFIGLLGPHIVRRFLGNDHRHILIGSMIMGALILVVSDCIGQNITDFTLPVGIITSFLGGPLFLYLLVRGYRKRGGKTASFLKRKTEGTQ